MSRQANRRSRWECGIEERSDEVGSSRPAGPGICGSKYGKAERPQGFWGQSPHRRTLGAEPLTEWRKLAKQAFRAGKLSYIELFSRILKRCIYLAYRLLEHSLAVLFKK